MRNRYILLVLIGIVFISGCTTTQTDISPIVKAMPEVQQFLSEHPNAEIKAALWSESAVDKKIEDIRADCGQQMEVQSLWTVSIKENNVELEVWLDASKQPICIIKRGSDSASPKNPDTSCPQVITPAINLTTSECIEYLTPCDVPEGWSIVSACPPIQTPKCPEICDDNNKCTRDYCSSETNYQCKHDRIVSVECGNKCPNSCDDMNSCTQDYCSSGTSYQCEHKPITPCCGNGICESTESFNECSEDCGSTDIYILSYCRPRMINYNTGKIGTPNCRDATEDLNQIDDKTVAISEAALIEIVLSKFTSNLGSLHVTGKTTSAPDTSGKPCLLVRADEDIDGVYETLVFKKCYNTKGEPINEVINVDTSKPLLFGSSRFINLDYIGEAHCPRSCDDMNPCTQDYCSSETDYQCEHKLITPCCGNEICESTESFNDCSVDCGSADIYTHSYCRPGMIDYSTGKIGTPNCRDATEDLNQIDGKTVAISEAAPVEIVLSKFKSNLGSIHITGETTSAPDTHGNPCLLVRADEDKDGVYETLVFKKCYNTKGEPINEIINIDTSKPLLFGCFRFINIDYIGESS